MGKAFMWGFIGFLGGLIFTELTDGKPAEKVDYNRMYFNTRTIYRPYPNQHYYDYGRHTDTFNNQRPNSTINHRTIVVGTIEVVERIKVVHKLKHLTILHNKEQNRGELKTNEQRAFT